LCYDVHMGARSDGNRSRGPRGLRLSESLEKEIQRAADDVGSTWSAMASELLEEAVRMRRVPGIAFVGGATGRRALIAGTGLEVWELIRSGKELDEDFSALQESYPWLSEMQLRSAMAYYHLFPAEIDARLRREEAWTPERVRRELPYAAAHGSKD
jgi:uncharacterized protein (DUF433 family)